MDKKKPFRTIKGTGLQALFGDEVPNENNNNTIDINLITLPPSQPRRYFDEEQLQQLTQSIKTHGILEPLLVRPIAEGKYELVAGERRYRSALDLKLTTVPVSIKTLSDIQARQIALIENLQRVDLNPVEETEGILELLSIELEQTVEEVISLLYKMNNESKKESNQNVLVKPEIKEVFDSLGLITWQSFVTSRLPLLNLPEDILEILRQGKIAYTKAIALSKIKDEDLRKEITHEAVEQKLSLRDLKTLIQDMTTVKEESEPQEGKSIESVITTTAKQLNKVKLWKSNPQKWKKVEKLIKEINILLIEEE
jgi:ParB family chromosome partitioning protein